MHVWGEQHVYCWYFCRKEMKNHFRLRCWCVKVLRSCFQVPRFSPIVCVFALRFDWPVLFERARFYCFVACLAGINFKWTLLLYQCRWKILSDSLSWRGNEQSSCNKNYRRPYRKIDSNRVIFVFFCSTLQLICIGNRTGASKITD